MNDSKLSLDTATCPVSTLCAMLCWCPWEVCPFLRGEGKGVDGEGGRGEVGGMGGEEGGESLVSSKINEKSLVN